MIKKNDIDDEEEDSSGGTNHGSQKPLKGAFASEKDWRDHDEEDEGGEGTGTGGATGEVEFHYKDAMSEQLRDDLLPAEEIKRLLAEHKTLHEARVAKQKQTRDQRAALKEGKQHAIQGRAGYGVGQGRDSPYKKHPISDKAQFSGIDKQMQAIPTENMAETNEDQKNEMEYQYNLQHRPEYAYRQEYRNTPKPRPY